MYDLRCDGLHNPLGTETTVPHFGWKNMQTHNGQKQAAYEVEVGSDSIALARGQADLWRSGRISDSEQINVKYNGKPLSGRQLCYWRVRTWDEQGTGTPWSSIARFAVGAIDGLRGEYIGCLLSDGTMAKTPMLRTTLTYHFPMRDDFRKPVETQKVASVSQGSTVLAYINSLGYHELYVNGRRVGEEVLQPAVSQLNRHSLIVTYDITPYLRDGENEIVIWLGQGWYRDNIFDLSVETQCMASLQKMGPLVKAEICEMMGNGCRTLAQTDTTWEVSPSGYRYTGTWMPLQFGGERFDANVQLDWTPAKIFTVRGMRATPQQFEGNRIIDTLSPKSIVRQADGSILLDFGRVVTGWFQAEFAPMPQGTVVTMEYTDHIVEGDTFQCQGESDQYVASVETQNFASLRTKVTKETFHEMSLPPYTFRNRFHHHAFRYVRITGADVREARALQISALNPKEASVFACSDERLNAVHDLIQYTLQCLTFSGYMVDCPHLERMGYGGDGNSSTMTLQTMYNVLPTYLNWLTAWGESQDEDGGLAYVAPSFPTGGGPYWSGFIVKAPWRTWVNYGDRRMVERLYEPMKRWLGYVGQFFEYGLLQPWPDTKKRMWFLGDWLAPDGVDIRGESVIHVSNCFLSECLANMAKMAKMLGYQDDYEQFTTQRRQLNTAIHTRFYHSGSHIYANGTPLDQTYALLTGLPSDSIMAKAVTKQLLTDCYGKFKGHIAAGLMGIPIFTEWVVRNRQADLMADLLRQLDYPGYLYMVKQGATATWESWNGDRSRVHNCYNGVGTWFYQALAGICPDESAPGYRHFFLDPQPVQEVSWVKATKPTPYGDIRVEINEKQMIVTIPVGTTATVFPGSSKERTLPAGTWEITTGN